MRLSITARPGPALAILSAALFGASTPFAKLLLGVGLNPWLLAGLLYLGSGVGLAVVWSARRLGAHAVAEAPLRGADLPWLAAVVLAGGVVAPVLLMYGLTTVPAASAALLLNLEAIATLVLAWVVFGEHVDRRLMAGAAAIVAAAVLLSWQSGPLRAGGGALAIAAACLAWGVDNNLTRKLSAADPVQIAMIKGLVAGAVNLGLAVLLGARLPGAAAIAGAQLVGFLGYGASLVLFVLALRHLGAARTSAYFSTAPFIGAVLAVLLLAEPVTLRLIIAGALMALGVYLHLTEYHEHEHAHEALAHEHRHRHDAEHQHEHQHEHEHEHGIDDPAGETHSHWHVHAPIVHSHPHYPDLHHRHDHRR